jgi:drug/metabolite transporter (DMT)-like permease
MGRSILSIVVGYIVTIVFVMISFGIAFVVLSKNGMYKEGSYEVSTMWLLVSFALGLIAAILGGVVCALIAPAARRAGTIKAFAAVILVAGILFAIPKFTKDQSTPPPPRTGQETLQELASNSREPRIATILNPIIGAIGVLIGGSLVRRKPPAP